MVYVLLLLIAVSVFFTFKLKKPILLTAPFGALFLFMIVQIAMVPLGFIETFKFILSLK
jgi:hypothetical protein